MSSGGTRTRETGELEELDWSLSFELEYKDSQGVESKRQLAHSRVSHGGDGLAMADSRSSSHRFSQTDGLDGCVEEARDRCVPGNKAKDLTAKQTHTSLRTKESRKSRSVHRESIIRVTRQIRQD